MTGNGAVSRPAGWDTNGWMVGWIGRGSLTGAGARKSSQAMCSLFLLVARLASANRSHEMDIECPSKS